MLGLPTAAFVVLLGLVFAANARRYGWLGVGAGFALVAAGFAIGINCFRSTGSGTRFDN